jgi:hypothetical protein
MRACRLVTTACRIIRLIVYWNFEKANPSRGGGAKLPVCDIADSGVTGTRAHKLVP